ncbi:MAG TPA: Coq4 family protein [Rhizomicrobium sp.]|jgi:ubiquinone biosynthesis protein COQ4|nr:Coq4 family protein [Rhizomicrobium sp.]
MFAQSAIDTRLRPLEAVKAVRRLMADPDATEEVFTILRAMRGRSGIRLFDRFRASRMGAQILDQRRSLFATLSDTDALAALPEGSLGRTYQRFMAEENLSPDGLVAPSQIWEEEIVGADVRLFRERMRDMHDLTHTLTGYGRDPLGELCLLAFTFSHTGNLGMGLIVLMGFLKIKSWKVRRAVLEAWRHGHEARCWFPTMDWETLLPEQILELRRRFAINEPKAYRAVTA